MQYDGRTGRCFLEMMMENNSKSLLSRSKTVHSLWAAALLQPAGYSSTKSVLLAVGCFFLIALLIPTESPSSPTSSPDAGVQDSLHIVLGVVCGFCLLMLILFGTVFMHKRNSNSFFW